MIFTASQQPVFKQVKENYEYYEKVVVYVGDAHEATVEKLNKEDFPKKIPKNFSLFEIIIIIEFSKFSKFFPKRNFFKRSVFFLFKGFLKMKFF